MFIINLQCSQMLKSLFPISSEANRLRGWGGSGPPRPCQVIFRLGEPEGMLLPFSPQNKENKLGV